MRIWEKSCCPDGAEIAAESIKKCNITPDDAGRETCCTLRPLSYDADAEGESRLTVPCEVPFVQVSL